MVVVEEEIFIRYTFKLEVYVVIGRFGYFSFSWNRSEDFGKDRVVSGIMNFSIHPLKKLDLVYLCS